MSEPTNAPEVPLDRVEWRVQGSIDNGGGVRVVAYLDAPTVSEYLDDWVGPFGWRDAYEATGKQGTLWCHLSVLDPESGEWVTKTDVGTASSQEAEKGLVSDAFKRVAMRKWGIGRNVFSLPVLRITEFREWEGKAYLNDQSTAQIRKLLADRGFTEAADAVRVASEDDEVEQGGAAPSGRARPASTSGGPSCAECGESLSGVSGVKRVEGENYHPDCAPEVPEEVPF